MTKKSSQKNIISTSSRVGQTLVEVLVAMLILVVGMSAILTLLAQSIFVSKTVTEDTTATYLAEEGIEIAGNLINHDMYAHLACENNVADCLPGAPNWGTCFGAGGYFEIDYTYVSDPSVNCSLGLHQYFAPPVPPPPPDFLEFDSTNNSYLYNWDVPLGDAATPTIFKRGIQVIDGASEITVISTVTWSIGGAAHSIALEDHFYDWRP